VSQLVKALREAGRSGGRPTAGFGARSQTADRKRVVLVGALAAADGAKVKAAFEAGADAVEITLEPSAAALAKVKDVASSASGPVGIAFNGAIPADFDVTVLDASGVDFVRVDSGDVPAAILLLEGPAIVLRVSEEFSDTMLKMLNFLPAKIIQVDSPADIASFTVRELMEKRVDRELIGKPLLMSVAAGVPASAAQVLALVSPNGLVVPAADVPAWKDAIANLKEPSEDEDSGGANISLKAPAA